MMATETVPAVSTNTRIRARRKQMGYTLQQVANHVGVSKAAVFWWEKPKDFTTPKGLNLMKLAQLLKCTVSDLTGVVVPDMESEAVTLSQHVTLNVLPFRYLTKGLDLQLPKTTLERAGVEHMYARFFVIEGHTMDGVMNDGTMVAVDVSDKNIRDGKLYLFSVNEWCSVGYLYMQPDGKIRVRHANDREYPDTLYNPDELSVEGRLFWYGVTLD